MREALKHHLADGEPEGRIGDRRDAFTDDDRDGSSRSFRRACVRLSADPPAFARPVTLRRPPS